MEAVLEGPESNQQEDKQVKQAAYTDFKEVEQLKTESDAAAPVLEP